MASELAILRSLAGKIAAELSQAAQQRWQLDPDYESTWAVMLSGPDGEELMLQHGIGTRLHVQGVYPSGPHGTVQADDVEIGVTRTRPVGQIAREITRRLLPAYRAELDRVRAVIAGQVEAAARRDATAARLLALPAVERWGPNGKLALRLPGETRRSLVFRISYAGNSVIVDDGSMDVQTWERMLRAAAPPAAADEAASGDSPRDQP